MRRQQGACGELRRLRLADSVHLGPAAWRQRLRQRRAVTVVSEKEVGLRPGWNTMGLSRGRFQF